MIALQADVCFLLSDLFMADQVVPVSLRFSLIQSLRQMGSEKGAGCVSVVGFTSVHVYMHVCSCVHTHICVRLVCEWVMTVRSMFVMECSTGNENVALYLYLLMFHYEIREREGAGGSLPYSFESKHCVELYDVQRLMQTCSVIF